MRPILADARPRARASSHVVPPIESERPFSPMHSAAPASAKIDLTTLLLSGAAGGAVGGLPLMLGVAQPAHLLITAAAAVCGGLVARVVQRPAVARPEAAPAATAAPDDGTAPPASDRAAAVAADLAALDPYFSVTREQLRSIVAQTEAAAVTIMASLQTLNQAQTRSAARIGGAQDRIVGFAERSDAALHDLARSLGSYLDRRLDETRKERGVVDAAAAQMRGLDALIVTLEKVGTATRMLALNANIEAGRAGQQGAGFKVIAQELQDLARTSQAAMTEARLQVSTVQRTIGAVLTADHGGDGTRTESERLQALMAELDGIARSTTQVLLGMARTELTEARESTGLVGDQVLAIFGQIQFQDVVRQQIEAVDVSDTLLQRCLADLGRRLAGEEPEAPVRPDAILETARTRYVTQIQRRVDAQALGMGSTGADAPDIELF